MTTVKQAEVAKDIADALARLDDDSVKAVASVLILALERVNVRKVEEGTAAGSGWRQGVQAEIGRRL